MSHYKILFILIVSVFCLSLAGCALPGTTVTPPEGLKWEDDVAAHPPAPQNLHVTVEEGHVRLEWDLPIKVTGPHSYDDEIDYYRVFRRQADSANAEPIGKTEELVFVDPSPPSGQVFYQVTAVHVGENEGSLSDEVEVTFAGAGGEQPQPAEGLTWEDDVATHPPPPQNLRATAEEGRVRLEWDLPIKVTGPHSYDDEIAHYRVFRRHVDSANPEPIGTTEEPTFVDPSPPTGQVFYQVTAVHVGENEGGFSDEVEVTLGDVGGEQLQSAEGLTWEDDVSIHPPPPQNLRATVEEGRVRLEWDPPVKVTVSHSYNDEIDYYRVFRRRADSANPEPIGKTEEPIFVDPSPPSGKVFYQVTAVHVGEYEGSVSDEVEVTPRG
jgi:fibronectin type 3 domain-containing protein